MNAENQLMPVEYTPEERKALVKDIVNHWLLNLYNGVLNAQDPHGFNCFLDMRDAIEMVAKAMQLSAERYREFDAIRQAAG